jgi:tRNA(Ile2) C34 agmatinyltransferase TiaS
MALMAILFRSKTLPVCPKCGGSQLAVPTFDGYENFECYKCGECSGCRKASEAITNE